MSKKLTTEQRQKLFKEIGREGGNARAKSLSPAKRRAIARKASKARWQKAEDVK